MKTNNQSVISNFFQGTICESHTGNLWVSADGLRLMNYSTCLVEVYPVTNEILVNETKYSVTTSKIQSYIRRHTAYMSDVRPVHGVYQGTSYLHTQLEKSTQGVK